MWTPTTDLFAWQQRAVEKIAPSRVGALFMEMGLGKTRTAIELAAQRQQRWDRLIWFCPVSIKPTIAAQWQQHTTLAAHQIHGFDDTTTERTVPQALVHIVGIESMSASARVVLTVNHLITTRTFVIVDESSYIKTPWAARTARITGFAARARYRLILTGTPLTQGVQDLFAQMHFLSPKILGYRSFYSFAANHLEYSDKHPGLVVRAHNTGLLAAKIAPYVYQVTKAEVLDLPPKLYESYHYDLTPEQRDAYAQAKDELLFRLDDAEISVYDIFRLFTALQQIVCGFWQHREMGLRVFPHHRLTTLDAILDTMPLAAKVIIWTKYRRCVGEIRDHLAQQAGHDRVATFFGDLDGQTRARELDRFRGDARFLVATPATGGHGLTLNEAHHVVFYTNEWKYSHRLQAEDRCHRIGQTQSVTYVDITARSSIDERIAAALLRKESLVDAFKRRVDQVKHATRAEVRTALHELVSTL